MTNGQPLGRDMIHVNQEQTLQEKENVLRGIGIYRYPNYHIYSIQFEAEKPYLDRVVYINHQPQHLKGLIMVFVDMLDLFKPLVPLPSACLLHS